MNSFKELQYKGPIEFSPEKQADGKYAIRGVPIFATHEADDKQHLKCVDDRWMRDCVEAQKQYKSDGFLPKLIIGHNSTEDNAPEKPAVGALDNYRFNNADGWLYADYVNIEPEDLPLLKRFPARSAEPSRSKPQINTVALLGGSPPFFKFPDVRFSEGDSVAHYCITMPNARYEVDDFQETQNGDQMSPQEKADYEKFCKYMKMYEGQNGGNGDEESGDKFNKEEDTSGKDESDNETSKEDNKMSDDKKKKDESKFESAELTAQYTELKTQYDSLVQRSDTLNNELVKLREDGERRDWSAKYAEQRIPAGRLDIKAETDFIMSLPQDKRAPYFERSIKSVPLPGTKPLDTKDHQTGKPQPGTKAEEDAINAHYSEGRSKGKNWDWIQAAKDYRATAAK